MVLYIKNTPQTVNNTTTFTTISGIDSGSLLANTQYFWEAVFICTSGNTPDIKFTIGKSAGLTDASIWWDLASSSGFSSDPLGFTDARFAGMASGDRIVTLVGIIDVGSSAGVFNLQFAQNTANVSDTTVSIAALEIYPSGDFISTAIGKPSDQSRSSTTTLADDADLVTGTLDENSIYKFDALLPFDSGFTANLKVSVGRTGLSDASIYWDTIRPFGSSGDSALGATFGFEEFFDGGSSTTNLAGISGILETGSDPGSIAIQWAQDTSNANNTTIRAGAALRLVKSD